MGHPHERTLFPKTVPMTRTSAEVWRDRDTRRRHSKDLFGLGRSLGWVNSGATAGKARTLRGCADSEHRPRGVSETSLLAAHHRRQDTLPVAAVTAFGASRGWFGVANGSGFRS